jgi:hypothetical protein
MIAKKLGPEGLRPETARILRPGIVYNETTGIEKEAPRVFNQKLNYFAKLGYWYGVERTIGNKIVDEGLLEGVMREVGKRGDTRMIRYLFQHGAGNLETAMVEAIKAHRNNFVLSCIDTPFISLVPFVEATLESDNLEILRILVPRLTRDRNTTINLRANRTSYWLYCFNQITSFYKRLNEYYGGFGLDHQIETIDLVRGTSNVRGAIASNLSQPLPFSYHQLESLHVTYSKAVKYLVFDIVTGQSSNYERLEWFLDSAHRRGNFNLEEEITLYVQALLPLIRDPKASKVLEKARQYLGLDWSRVVDPLPTQDQEDVIFYLVNLMTASQTIYFDPLQPEVRQAWLEYCFQFPIDPEEEEDSEPERQALDWILNNYPGRDDSTVSFHSSLFSRYPVPDSMGIDLHEMILRFFKSYPLTTLEKILEHHQMDLWDELSGQFVPEEHEAQILGDVACVAGLDSIVEMYQKPEMGPVDAGNFGWFRLQKSFDRIKYSLHPELPAVKRLIPQVEELFESKQEFLEERLKLLI